MKIELKNEGKPVQAVEVSDETLSRIHVEMRVRLQQLLVAIGFEKDLAFNNADELVDELISEILVD